MDAAGGSAGPRRLGAGRPTADGLEALLAVTVWAFDATAASVATVSEAGDALEYVAAHGPGADAIVGQRLPLARGIGGFAAVSGQTLLVDDLSNDARFARDVAEASGYVPRAILASPIVDDAGSVIGVLSILDPGRHDGDVATPAGRLAALAADALIRRRSTEHDSPDPADLGALLASLPSDRRADVVRSLEQLVRALGEGGA
ncbi:MAG TPA: GAF domain-containing protein [Acidimicrobiales bacterium]